MSIHEGEEEEEEENLKMSYPLDPNSYKILQEIGCGVSATVYKAACLPLNSTIVAIKAIDLERSRANLDDVRREAKAMALLTHPNILKAHCSFTVDHHLWVVMPFMSAGSLHSIISSCFPDGLNESCIAIVLRETLNALLYLHDQGHLHRDIKAGNILVDSDGSVKLADFGVSASIYESNSSHTSSTLFSSSSLRFNELAGTPYWMAPEVIHSHVGYSFKADIWSFGITALELAHGRPPLSHLPPWKSLFLRITNRLRISDYESLKTDKNKTFSKNFKDMVATCLSSDPSRRPTAEKLLKHPFFKNCRSANFLVRSVLQGLPTVEERYKEHLQTSRCSEVLVDVDENGEEVPVGPVEKHRRISGWNFNEQVLELDPVFPPRSRDNDMKQVRLGRNDIFQDYVNIQENEKNNEEPAFDAKEKGDEDARSLTCKYEEDTISDVEEQEDICGTVEDPMVATAPLVPLLKVIMNSLEDEREVLTNLITSISGAQIDMKNEEEIQQTVAQLSLELEQERKRSYELETELEILRQTASETTEDVSQHTYGFQCSDTNGSINIAE